MHWPILREPNIAGTMKHIIIGRNRGHKIQIRPIREATVNRFQGVRFFTRSHATKAKKPITVIAAPANQTMEKAVAAFIRFEFAE